MSDLPARITQVIDEHVGTGVRRRWPDEFVRWECACGEWSRDHSEHVAAAIVAELGLAQDGKGIVVRRQL